MPYNFFFATRRGKAALKTSVPRSSRAGVLTRGVLGGRRRPRRDEIHDEWRGTRGGVQKTSQELQTQDGPGEWYIVISPEWRWRQGHRTEESLEVIAAPAQCRFSTLPNLLGCCDAPLMASHAPRGPSQQAYYVVGTRNGRQCQWVWPRKLRKRVNTGCALAGMAVGVDGDHQLHMDRPSQKEAHFSESCLSP